MMSTLLIISGFTALVASNAIVLYMYLELRWEREYQEENYMRLIKRVRQAEARSNSSNCGS